MFHVKMRYCLVVLAIVLAFSVIGATTVAQTPQYGGTLVFLQAQDPGTLDFAMLQATTETSILLNIFEPLLRIDPETLQLQPHLAKSWQILDGGKTYVFHLHDNVMFHNLHIMTATDVKYTLEYLNDPKFPRYVTILRGIEKVEVIDNHTVSVTLSTVDTTFLSHLTEISILPDDPTVDQAVEPIGTGPFKFVEWKRAQYVKLEKFGAYWQDGLPYLDGITFKFVPDIDVQLLQLQTGQADFMMMPAFSQFPQFETSDDIELIGAPVSTNAYILMPNTAKGPTSDFRVRQAISYALDRNKCNQVLYGQMPLLTSTTVPPNHPLVSAYATQYVPRDVKKAKELLAEAGYPNGFELELAYFTVAPQYQLLAIVIQASLADAGITLDMQQMEIGMFVDKVYNARDYQLGLTATSLKPNVFDMLSHTYAESTGYALFTDTMFPEITMLLDSAKQAPTQEMYNQILQDLQLIISIKQPAVAIGNMANISGARVSVKGFLQLPRPGRYLFESTWLNK